MHPSNKPGTPGKPFLDSVNSFFQFKSTESVIDPLAKNFEDVLCDLNLEESDAFHELGILRINVNDVSERSLTICCLGTANVADIHSYLQTKFEVDEFILEFREIELLYYALNMK